MGIQKVQPDFAESEMRAAKMMLRLIHFDSLINNNNNNDNDDNDNNNNDNNNKEETAILVRQNLEKNGVDNLWGEEVTLENNGPFLTREVLEVCNQINECRDNTQKIKLKKMLQELAGSIPNLYNVIRYFKWSKTVCTWKYSEVTIIISISIIS